MRSKRFNYSNILLLTTLLSLGIMVSCRGHQSPKPKGYFRIEFPEHSYQKLDTTFPYSFEYAKIAEIQPDSHKDAEKYWCNIAYPSYNGKIHLSYKKINNNFYDLLEDSRKLAYKHTIKADAINERLFEDSTKHVIGILYEIKGNAASPYQFFLTDSIEHFLRGSLYFNTIPNKDSLAPVIDFIGEDITHLIETLEWTNY